MLKYLDIPPLWLGLHLCLAWGLAQCVPIMRWRGFSFGWVCVAIGAGFILWSAAWFWRKRTAIEPRHKPKALIVEGPYRINRNPIYTGMWLILFGYVLTLGAITPLILLISLPLVLTYRFILEEEAMLRTVFGRNADHYIAQTRRW